MRERRPLATVLQVAGFLIGIALIVWCVRSAVSGDGATEIRTRLAAASPGVIAGLVACTLVSLVANGTLFWSLIRPVHPLRFTHVQAVNGMASFLNYVPLPLRAGLLARVGYHWRVDRLGLGLIAAWLFAALASMAIAFVATVLPLPLAPIIGLPLVAAIIVVKSLAGVGICSFAAGRPRIARLTKGAERMVAHPLAFGEATALRLVDIAAWAARMVLAVQLLGIDISREQSALLGIAAVIASMNPLGRFGFREAAVAWFATTIFAGSMSPEELASTFARLALVESAAEGVVTVPLGGAAALWCWRRVVTARQDRGP
ncbi:MAG: hypothetical protein U0572_02630 [Phycisphaerales bacterium]